MKSLIVMEIKSMLLRLSNVLALNRKLNHVSQLIFHVHHVIKSKCAMLRRQMKSRNASAQKLRRR